MCVETKMKISDKSDGNYLEKCPVRIWKRDIPLLIACMQKQTNSAPSVPPTLKFCP